MPAGRILVIAPNADLRRSLAFALETEGYVVTAHAELVAQESSRGYDAVVLDHKAARGTRDDVLSFCRQASPVVLLASQPQPWLVNDVFRAVPTPLMGSALSQAVADAVDAGRHPVRH